MTTPEEIAKAREWLERQRNGVPAEDMCGDVEKRIRELAAYAEHVAAPLREKVAWSLGRLTDEALKVGQLKVLLETAVDDYESHNGRPKNANHWTHKARAALEVERTDG